MIYYGGIFYEIVGREKEEIDVEKESLSLKELLKILFRKYPRLSSYFENDINKVFNSIIVAVNNVVVDAHDFYVINDGDTIHIAPLVHGG